MRDEIFYSIMIDRFYNSKANEGNSVKPIDDFNGGNIRGIIEKLDYIKGLGATVILITPPFLNDEKGYHGYWVKDFYTVDPRFGTIEDLRNLVSKAHEKGMKVVLDMVYNHTGYSHPWLKDGKHKDWYHPKREICNWLDPEDLLYGWLCGLPDLNHENRKVRDYLIDVSHWWIRQTGVDGFRLDAVKHVPVDFWEELISSIRSVYPNFFFIGEVFDNGNEYIKSFYGTGMDGVFYFPLYGALVDCLGRSSKMYNLKNVIEDDLYHHSGYNNCLFIDNHDTPRFSSVAKDHKTKRLKMALAFLMAYNRIPVIYYGTEVEMEGECDPYNRRYMDWGRIGAKRDIINYIRKLVEIRKREKLYDGKISIVYVDDIILAFQIKTEEKRFLMVLNNSIHKIELRVKIDGGSVLSGMIKNNKVYLNNGFFNIEAYGLEAQLYKIT